MPRQDRRGTQRAWSDRTPVILLPPVPGLLGKLSGPGFDT